MAPVLVRPRYGTGIGVGRSSEDVVTDGDVTSNEYSGSGLPIYGGVSGESESELYYTGELFSPLSKATESITDVIDLEAGKGEVLGDSWFFTTPTEEIESAVPVLSRETEFAWVSSHAKELAQFQGQWVAVDGERVVASGCDFTEATKEARSNGVEIPYVIKIETGEESPFVG